VHFLRIEGIIKEVEFSSGFTEVFDLRKAIGITEETTVKEWIITDFDHYLKGNPHVQS
jgi:hypothetical protein